MMNVPKIRFLEYQEEWKVCSIEDIFDRVSNSVAVEEDTLYRQIGIRSHGNGLFYKEDVTGKELGKKRVFWVEANCFVVNIVFAWERAVAKTTDKEIGMIASHRFPMYKPKEGVVYLDYITRYFITAYGNKILVLASPGGAGRNKTLGQDEFLKSKICLPCYEEQRKISTFLDAVDKRIEEQRAIVANWENQKRGLLEKIFNREVAFKDKNDDYYPEWERMQIRECLSYEQPTKYIVASDEYNDKNTIPVLTANKGFILGYTDEVVGVYDKGDVIIYDDFTMDSKFVDFPFKVKSSAMKMLTAKENIDLYFMYCYFKYLNFSQEEHSRSYISKVEPTWVLIPIYQEQRRISENVRVFDKKIEAERKILEDWQQIKKGLLQQMFV